MLSFYPGARLFALHESGKDGQSELYPSFPGSLRIVESAYSRYFALLRGRLRMLQPRNTSASAGTAIRNSCQLFRHGSIST